MKPRRHAVARMRPLVRAILAVVLVTPTTSWSGHAQHAWQADLSVRALELTRLKTGAPITARVVVVTDGGEARNVRLEIMLPVGVAVSRQPPGCVPSPGPVMSLSARVSCTFGTVAAHTSREVTITTTDTPPAARPLHVAVFAFSDTPDPLPMNNFVDRVVP